jgi:cytochrome c oxidase subunit 2
MKTLEIFANILMVVVLIGTAAGIFVYEGVLESQRECITIRFRQYERGNPTPNTVHLKKGEEVCLRLTSEDTTHALNIPDFNINSEPIHPGKWTYLRFTPEESGTFSFVCNIVCSPMHSRVRGKFVIE